MVYRVGDWSFDPASHELRRPGEHVRLEHRTSRALQLLCEQRGRMVSKAELTAHLWGDRQLSANSLAVVITDLRKALGDDARDPRFVQTVAKAGYRLLDASEAFEAVEPRRRVPLAALAGMLAMVGLAAWGWRASVAADSTVVLLGTVANATGDPAYDPLAKASDGLIVNRLSGRPGIRVVRLDPDAKAAFSGRVVRLNAKLVLWTGQPDVVFVAEDPRSGEVVWSASAYGPEPTIPTKVNAQLDRFVATLRPPKKQP